MQERDLEKEEQKRIAFQEICNLKQDLTSSGSDIGDWKLIKIMEYQSAGLEPPYDIDDLHAKRKVVRDRINDLERLIEEL